MKTDGQTLLHAVTELPVTPLAIAAAKARSAQNNAHWQTFLPQDCVAAMIRQGWDHTVGESDP